MRRLLVSLAAGVALVAAGGSADASRPAPTARCASGSTAAVIGGKKVCLKAGQRCDRRKDRQYHKYKLPLSLGSARAFPQAEAPERCHAASPSLPGLKVDVGGYKLYIECFGSGSPTVILEPGTATAGATGTLRGWNELRTTLGGVTRCLRL